MGGAERLLPWWVGSCVEGLPTGRCGTPLGGYYRHCYPHARGYGDSSCYRLWTKFVVTSAWTSMMGSHCLCITLEREEGLRGEDLPH